MSGILDFVNVSKAYGSLWSRGRIHALEGVSFSLLPGEIFGFLGPNGAGKTTAIHLAMGFLRATSGMGALLGQPFGHPATRRRVGFMPETVPLYARRARTLLCFYGALNGLRDPRLRERCRDVLHSVDLEAEADRNVGRFSRGMQQRIGLAQALLNDPELLILDEPTSALDPMGRIAVRDLLLEANRRGKTVFLSSHLLSEVQTICHRVAILRDGKLLQVLRMSDLQNAGDELEIVVRGIAPHVLPGGQTEANGTISFRVPAASQRETIQRVWEAGGDVLQVNPCRQSLEEVFAQVIEGSSRPSLRGDGS